MQHICDWDSLPEYPEELEYALWEAKEEERDLEDMKIRGLVLSGMDLRKVGFHRVSFENCRLLNCNFDHGAFRKVRFKNCDLSNSDFGWSYLKECVWEDVKAVGIKAQNAKFTHVTMQGCNLRYANLGESRYENWTLQECDFTDSFLTNCQLKDVVLRDNRFIRTSFIRTSLKGLDFTSGELMEAQVSEDGRELAGAKVDIYQAAEFARLLGLVVKY